jgi:hypothetical protein
MEDANVVTREFQVAAGALWPRWTAGAAGVRLVQTVREITWHHEEAAFIKTITG